MTQGAGPRGRRLAAILMLDVAGFSAMMDRDEEATVSRVVAFHGGVSGLVSAHGGRVVKTAGDSVFGEFESIVEAFECAVAIQRAQAASETTERLLARIGLHVGDVVVQGDDLFGDGVNIAARLEPLADPGGIALSEAVYLEVGKRSSLPFVDDGPRRLKNIEREVRVYRIPATAFGLPRPPGLPAVSASGDRDLSTLVEGVAGPAEKILAAMDERLREKGVSDRAWRSVTLEPARVVRRPGELVINGGFLAEIALGVFLLLARTTGWTSTGIYPLAGCILLGMAAGSLTETIVRRRGARLLWMAAGLAVGALFLSSEVTRVILWILSVLLLAAGLQRLRTRV